MVNLLLFLEDIGQEAFITEVIKRIAEEKDISVNIEVRNGTGGLGKAIGEFRRFLNYNKNNAIVNSDLLIVAIDGNSIGRSKRKKEIENIAKGAEYGGPLVCAIPEPHIEKWYLIDKNALRIALQSPVTVSTKKNQGKDFYKRLLAQAFSDAELAGTLPSAFARQIVRNMNFYQAGQFDPSFSSFVDDLKAALQQYQNLKI